MKKIFITLSLALAALSMSAKDIREVVFTTEPEMECKTCESKIREQLRFEKGIKEIKTDIPTQTVTLRFDADKTSTEKLKASLHKIGYEASEVQSETPQE